MLSADVGRPEQGSRGVANTGTDSIQSGGKVGENLMGSGYYKDEYICIDGEWKFKLRELHMEYLVKPGANWR